MKEKTPISKFEKIIEGKQYFRGSDNELKSREVEYLVPDLPYYKNFSNRIFAKLIDFAINLIGFLVIFFVSGGWYADIIDFLIYAFLLMVVSNSILETILGKTIGKMLFKIQVIDDYGRKPNIMRSFARNFLSTAMSFAIFRKLPVKSSLIQHHQHNQMVKCYIIKDDEKDYILSRIENYKIIDEIGNEIDP